MKTLENIAVSSQSLVVEILNTLLRAPQDRLDRAIVHALGRLGRFADADRSYLFQISDDRTLRNSHEWVADGVTPLKDRLQAVPCDLIPSWLGEGPVHLPDLQPLPPDAPERVVLIDPQVQSLLVVPLRAEGRALGLVGFDVTREKRVFSTLHIRLLKSAADVFATVLLRRDAECRAKAAQMALAQTTDRLMATLKAMPDLVVEEDEKGRFVDFHTSTPDRWPGLSAAHFGKPLVKVLPPGFATYRARVLAEVAAQGRSDGQEVCLTLAGAPVWVEISAAPRQPGGDGALAGHVFVLRDIGKRKLAEQARALREAELAATNEELRHTLAERDRAERRLGDINDVSNQWYWEQDADLRFTHISDRNIRAAHVPIVEHMGRRREDVARDCGADVDTPEWQAFHETVAARLPFDGFVYALRGADGNRAWVRISGKPVFDVDGNFAGYHGVGTDVSDLMRREEEVRAMAGRFAATLNAVPDLLAELDSDGRYVGFYAEASKRLTQERSAFLGLTVDEVLPAPAAAVYRDAMQRIDAEGVVSGLRYYNDMADYKGWREISGARKEAGADGDRPGYVFLVRDVTEDQDRKDRLGLLSKITELMTNFAVVVDNDSRVVWVNPAFEAHTGYALDEIRGLPVEALTRAPDTDPATIAYLTDCIARGEQARAEILNRDKAGVPYWVDLNIHPLLDDSGTLRGYVSVETVITEQKRSRAAMEDLATRATRARGQLENALEALPDGVVIFDHEDRLVIANSTFRALRPDMAGVIVEGAALGDLLHAGLEHGVYPGVAGPTSADPQVLVAQYKAGADRGEVQLPDGRWLRRMDRIASDGGRISVELDVTARRNQIAALDEMNADLTRALDERNAVERRLGSIMEGAEVGTWEWSVASGTIAVNGRWSGMLGYTRAEVEPMTMLRFIDMLHPDDLPILMDLRAKAFSTDPHVITAEFRLRHKRGHWVWVLSRGRVTAWSDTGRTVTVSGVHLDISDRKRLEEQIISGRNFLDSVMETSISAIAVIDLSGSIIFANPEAEKILGLTRSEIVGRSYADPVWQIASVDGGPIAPEDIPFNQAVARNEPVRNVRHAIRWPDGTLRVLSVNAVPLIHGTEGQVVCSFSDVTEQLETLARFQHALSQAEEASRAKSLFLANMSHEIRTPLNGVLGMAELLESSLTEPRQQRMISTIRNSGEVLLSILNNILDMSKIESGKFELEDVPFNPADLARQVESVYALKAEEKGLEFEVLTSLGCEAGRMGDPYRIQQIFHNLLSNALKFTDKGSVSMKLTCRPDRPLVIEVADTGIGMTAEQVGRVFDSFEQADGSVTRRFGGTGLGMSIVRQLVGRMGGEITIDSAPGVGTRATVTLPLNPAQIPVPSEMAMAVRAPETGLKGRRLLVADDSFTNRLVLQEMLADSGVEITAVEDGRQAVDAWQGGDYDLLLLDISMPVMDGLTALKLIRAAEEERGSDPVPAIAVTANAMAHQVADYIICGFDAHLSKPFRRHELLRAITSLLR